MLWERAAQAAVTSGNWAAAVEHAGRARDYHLQRGQARAAASAQAIAGQALRSWGRHADAREQLAAAVEVLRADPGTDTVRGLEQLAALEVFAGSAEAGRLSSEALTLGQALDVDASTLSGLYVTRGIYLNFAGRAAPRRPLTSAKPRGSPHRPTTTSPWDAHSPICPTRWRSPLRRPRRRRHAPPPGTCAGPAPGTTCRSRSAT